MKKEEFQPDWSASAASSQASQLNKSLTKSAEPMKEEEEEPAAVAEAAAVDDWDDDAFDDALFGIDEIQEDETTD